MAKLSEEEWFKVQSTWENDPRDGFAWIVKEMKLPVSNVAVFKKAKTENWSKKVNGTKKVNGKKVNRKKLTLTLPESVNETEAKSKEKTDIQAHDNNQEEAQNPELTGREKIFLKAYLSNGMNATDAAIKAGYTKEMAPWKGWELTKKSNIERAIRADIQERCDKFGIDADAAFDMLIRIINFDANEFSSYVKYCCPMCWSTNGRPQKNVFQYYEEKDKWKDKEEKKKLENPTYGMFYKLPIFKFQKFSSPARTMVK